MTQTQILFFVQAINDLYIVLKNPTYTLPPHIYSVRIQNTFSKISVVYIKRCAC